MPRAVILNSHPTIRLSIHLLLLHFSILKTKFPNSLYCHTCSWSSVLVLCGSHALAAGRFILCFLKLRFRGTVFRNDQKTKMKCSKHKYFFTGKRYGFTVSKYNIITGNILKFKDSPSFWGEKLTLHFPVLSKRTRLPEGLAEKYCNCTPSKHGTAECPSEHYFSRISDTLR